MPGGSREPPCRCISLIASNIRSMRAGGISGVATIVAVGARRTRTRPGWFFAKSNVPIRRTKLETYALRRNEAYARSILNGVTPAQERSVPTIAQVEAPRQLADAPITAFPHST